jgi:hypothetical protein
VAQFDTPPTYNKDSQTVEMKTEHPSWQYELWSLNEPHPVDSISYLVRLGPAIQRKKMSGKGGTYSNLIIFIAQLTMVNQKRGLLVY